MQKSERRFKGKSVPVIWRVVDVEESIYVPRCSFCGKFRKKLLKHWFYTGIYCYSCVQDVLYDNARSVKEINGET